MLFVTVPTAGNRSDLLADLVRTCGVPPERFVVVATAHDVAVSEGVVKIDDLGRPNIQRWWNAGVDEAKRRGATVVAVINDDIRLGPTTLAALHTAMLETGATIASPTRPGIREGLWKRRIVPYSEKIWGALWLLDLSTGLRADERYVWWYGDHDLDIRARTRFNGIVTRDVEWEHLHPGVGTARSASLTAQSDLDAQTYYRQYARILSRTRRVQSSPLLSRLFERINPTVARP